MDWKKTLIKIGAFILTLLLLLGLAFGTVLLFDSISKPYEIYLTKSDCISLFGVTPLEFLHTELEFYDETGDFREESSLDQDGNLILCISKKQCKKWLKTDWLVGFEKNYDKENFYVSSDYTELKIYVPSDIEAGSEEYKEFWSQVSTIKLKLSIIHWLNETPLEQIRIKYTEIDGSTGEILYDGYIYFTEK